jgi:Flp pilus assembly protein TadD
MQTNMSDNPSSPQPNSPEPIVITIGHPFQSFYPAKLSLLSALATDPADYVARILLACILNVEGDEEDAEFLLWHGIVFQPVEPAIYYKLAGMLDSGGRTQEALELLEELFNRAEECPLESKPRLDRARALYASLQRSWMEENHETAGERLRPNASPSSSSPPVQSTSACS